MSSSVRKKSPRHSSPTHGYSSSPNQMQQQHHNPQPSFPLPAYLDFVPGGLDYGIASSNGVACSPAVASTSTSPSHVARSSHYPTSLGGGEAASHWHLLSQLAPEPLVQKALVADDTLRKYAIRYQSRSVASGEGRLDVSSLPHRLPSLSALAEAAFAPLTGVHSSQVRKWADAMVLAHLPPLSDGNEAQDSKEMDPVRVQNQSEKELIDEFELKKAEIVTKPMTKGSSASGASFHQDLVRVLNSMRQKSEEDMLSSSLSSPSSLKMCLPVRPCGYVFRSGDIAWNCKTCQHDNTCVLCDECFQRSDHTGHEVTFHKTSPGGCCDCGDLEAWKAEGCCPLHRPRESMSQGGTDMKDDRSWMKGGSESLEDSMEAFRSMLKGRKDGEQFVKEMLPEKFAAALGVVIGAAVQAIVQAVDGAGIGADPVQWTRRWADQLRRIHDGKSVDEEYVLSHEKSCVATIGQAMKLPCPNRFRLHLRLHNDDVHTFDEVIDALWSSNGSISRILRRQEDTLEEHDTSNGLVSQRKVATEKTQLVDSEGQVLVRDYLTIEGAQAGFDRLKSSGLHCAVLSTPQIELENRARVLLSWLTDIASAHPAVSALVVHALVDVTEGEDVFGGALVWNNARMIPSWSFPESYLLSARVAIQEHEDEYADVIPGWRRRMDVFPPHLSSSYLTREEQRQLHKLGFASVHDFSSPSKGVDLDFYARVPYSLHSDRYKKSPHSLWGVMPSPFAKSKKYSHPIIERDTSTLDCHHLVDRLIVLDTDLRKQQEADMLTSKGYTHTILGLHMISGVGLVDVDGDKNGGSSMKPTADDWRQLLSISSYRAPTSPLLMLLLLDPYPTKQLRAAVHQLFLSLLIDARMKVRLAASLGAIAYRPLTTLFCAGVGTDADTILHFTVQFFTAGSIVRALCNAYATDKLLSTDHGGDEEYASGVFCLPLAHNIIRCIHTNLLGASEEVRMVLKNTDAGQLADTNSSQRQRTNIIPALVYQQGEQPINTLLPAAPDDGFLDCRSTRHKRLPHLLRDLEYVLETPATAVRLLKQQDRIDGIYSPMPFTTVWCRLLRLAQGIDPQKRKVSGGHVEYEKLRWLEAFSLSLNFAGARDKLAESLPCSADGVPGNLTEVRTAMGNLLASLLREMKWWLYNEGVLVTLPSATSKSGVSVGKMDALQRSTLHVSTSSLGATSFTVDDGDSNKTPAFSCATQIKMTENHLEVIEAAIRIEQSQHRLNGAGRGTIAGDWLRVPHSPHGGDWFSFHLPLHRSIARNVLAICTVIVPDSLKEENPFSWWQIPTLDDTTDPSENINGSLDHPLCSLLRPTLRSSNCRITWSAGPDCTSEEAQRRRSRSRAISAAVAAAKVIHSLCDHPLRCLAASEQIRRHLWLRNGSTAAGMALNYGTTPLCRSFRDLDLTMVQLSACGFSIGLGARRVFALLLSRFDLEGFLCDLERKSVNKIAGDKAEPDDWVMPKRLQDPEHAQVLMEAFFSILCIIVTELPPPPPTNSSDSSPMKAKIRRELLHALAVKPLTYSKAIDSASNAVTRRDENCSSCEGDDVTSFRAVFELVLKDISDQRTKGSRGAPTFFLKDCVSDEYDPCFFHLKGSEHQQAMDNIARLRKVKSSQNKNGSCFPIVSPPPVAHPRFVPCRLLLHLPALDAAIRRGLMFVLTGGDWLPPPDPSQVDDDLQSLLTPSFSADQQGLDGKAIVSSFRKARVFKSKQEPFSVKTVDASTHSFLEMLQLLTLQVHTLEQVADMHRSHPNLDYENKMLSSSLSINTYLGRLVHVPPSLLDVWAFKCAPEGPLTSKGSGLNKASILGLLIALYEHRSDHGSSEKDEANRGEEDIGGARYLVASGLRWFLRFISALVDGAQTVRYACKSATDGIPPKKSNATDSALWTIDEHLQSTVQGMLHNLPDLWPNKDEAGKEQSVDRLSDKNRQARKAAQMRIMERMKKQQASFAASIAEDEKISFGDNANVDEEADLCIICRCDDEDGENNGPLGYLGHVQRSKTLQLRSQTECLGSHTKIGRTYRVIGDKGCQLRRNESIDSAPVACIPVGSIVEVERIVVSSKYDLQSRRVFVKYVTPDDGKIIKGWASVQSTQGYVILSPIVDVCFNYSRWGGTRPLIRQCGHAAHIGCVDTHVASIHQKSQADSPYDGRFAADIEDGEFLCPLCKQLCNIVVPSELMSMEKDAAKVDPIKSLTKQAVTDRHGSLHDSLTSQSYKKYSQPEIRRAINQYGNYLEHSMQVFSWDPAQSRKRKAQKNWHNSIKNWDFKEDENDRFFVSPGDNKYPFVSDILRLLRQLHISWAAAGHTAAAAEASARGLMKSNFEPSTSDPWSEFDSASRDSHSMLIELRRTLAAASCLQNVVGDQINKKLERDSVKHGDLNRSVVGYLLGNILKGEFWTSKGDISLEIATDWQILSALLSSMPCHVAKDETLSLRQEARAVSAQIWAIKATNHQNPRNEHVYLPPIPLSVRKVPNHDRLSKEWGSMHPSDAMDGNLIPFRPAMASCFLYLPLLSWDMTTLSGAIFSTILSSDNFCCDDLVSAACTLLVGRMIQVLATLNEFQAYNCDDASHFEADIDVQTESASLVVLLNHVQTSIRSDTKPLQQGDQSSKKVLSFVSHAILPYARTLVLLLRAAMSAARLRGKASIETIDEFLENEDTLFIEDGFFFMQQLHCPMPSDIIRALETSDLDSSSAYWGRLINRWIDAAVALDTYQGSRGDHLEYDHETKMWIPKLTKLDHNVNAPLSKKPSACDADEENVSVDYEDTAMEISNGSLHDSIVDEVDEVMEDEDERLQDPMAFINGVIGDIDDAESSDEEMEFVDFQTFDDEIDDISGLPSLPTQSSDALQNVNDESDRSVYSWDEHENVSQSEQAFLKELDDKYANVSTSAIIPFQPSLLGLKEPGPGPRGASLDHRAASNTFFDASHLGLIHCPLSESTQGPGLVRLPRSFVELYGIVNKVKMAGRKNLDDQDEQNSSEMAICLVTGAIIRAGSEGRYRLGRRAVRAPGACTKHARKTGSGTGIFFLPQKCTVLLVHNKKSAYWASLYVDENGEEDPNLHRGRPLFLNEERYEALATLWRQHGIPGEVAQIRSTSDRVIRDNWY